MSQIRPVFNLTRPIQLLLALFTYGFGVGLARYLGATILLEPQFLGGVIVILVLAASNLLTEYFRPFSEPVIPAETRKMREELCSILLTTSLSCLGMAVIFVFLLQWAGFLHPAAAVILTTFVLLALANAVPPFRFANRGLGELSTSILIASLTPTLAFLFQFGSFHRLLTIFSIPLFLLTLAYLLALNFPAYAEDIKYERQSLLTSLTWQRAVPLHNALTVLAYLFLATAPFLGVPFGLVWPALLTLPLAAYQVFTLRNLADGGKPVWTVFSATATAVIGLTTYLIAFTFWLR